MKKLIVNADDFGLTPGVNAAVIRAHREGILTSATLMAGGLAWQEAVSLSRATPTLGVGVHLTLTALAPVLPPQQVPSLVDQKGRFRRQLWRAPLWRRPEVKAEWRAQIQRLVRAGIKPTHLDSHHHVHLWPSLLAVACELAQEFAIPALRVISPASFRVGKVPPQLRPIAAAAWRRGKGCPRKKPLTVAPLERVGNSRTSFSAYLAQLGPGVHELFCHPGSTGDKQLAAISSLAEKRAEETELLCARWLREELNIAKIVVVNYHYFREGEEV